MRTKPIVLAETDRGFTVTGIDRVFRSLEAAHNAAFRTAGKAGCAIYIKPHRRPRRLLISARMVRELFTKKRNSP